MENKKPRRANYLEIIADADTPTDLIDLLLLVIDQLRVESSEGMQTKNMTGYDAKIYHENRRTPNTVDYYFQLAKYNKERIKNET